MLYLQYTHPYNPLPQTQKHDRLCRAIVWLLIECDAVQHYFKVWNYRR